MSTLKLRPCIVCSTPTLERAGRYKDPRCSSWLPCALRRNAARARPKPMLGIVAQAIRAGHPVTERDAQLALREHEELEG